MELDQPKKKANKALLIFNCLLLALGGCGGPLIMRLYFLRGGHRVWLSAGLETAGWPLNLIPLIITYLYRRRQAGARPGHNASQTGEGLASHVSHQDHAGSKRASLILMDLRIFLLAAFVGILTGLDDYMYAYGVARLPTSTSALIIASQLGFTALFAFLLVKQKFTAFTVNTVFLLTLGAGVLAIGSSSDKPKGESNREYYKGFASVVGASALYGFVLPLIEWTYTKAKQGLSYTLVLEIQFVMCFFATAFCVVGMIINNDFKVIPREAGGFELGMTMYYVVLVCYAVLWQCFFLGAIGVVYCSSSLVSGILIAVILPVTEVLAVIFYQESFRAEKGVSLVLSLWGFVSYFYGEIKLNKLKKETRDNKESELVQITVTSS